MRAFWVSDRGMVREVNQDCALASCDQTGNLPNLFVVADGMGGHKAGDFASAYSIRRLVDLIRDRSLIRVGKEPAPDAAKIFKWAIPIVNREVFEIGSEEADLFGMGTTLVCATIKEERLTVANVGDSRLYVYSREYGLRQITRDHSLVEELVRKGQITRDSEIYKNSKNVITRAIGTASDGKADLFEIEIEPGDQILLCSDGLTNMVSDDVIAKVLFKWTDPRQKAEELVEVANENGGTDNITVLIVETEESDFCLSDEALYDENSGDGKDSDECRSGGNSL